jgi:YggT family protein
MNLYVYCLIGIAIVSWLLAFNVLNRGNPLVSKLYYFLERITEPVLMPVRRVIPPIGGIDISPVILILLITFLEQLIQDNYTSFGV